MYRIFLNFAKSCILSFLPKFDNKEKIHRADFEIAKFKGVVSESYCRYGSI